ncbi:MAG: endonuclease domain-containing protein [Hyphomicrobiaceae bacterium]
MADGRARSLRKRPTIAEQQLWDELKLLRHEGYHFRRQAPIRPYIVDFVCFSQRLVIEVDGAQHSEHKARAADARRDRDLYWRGFDVLRFDNSDVMDKFDGVMREVLARLGQRDEPMPLADGSSRHLPPPLTPPHKGEGDPRAENAIVNGQPSQSGSDGQN